MSDDTRTTVPSQFVAGALTHHPTPKVRTVSTTQTTGELSLRYIPRPTPPPDVSTDVTCDDWPEDDSRWVSEYPGIPPAKPHASRKFRLGDYVRIRHGMPQAGRRGIIAGCDYVRDEFSVLMIGSERSRWWWPANALEPIDAKSLLPCPDPATAVPRPGPDTLISLADAHQQAVAIAQRADQERRAAAREENDRDERLLGLSHTYRRELLCFPA